MLCRLDLILLPSRARQLSLHNHLPIESVHRIFSDRATPSQAPERWLGSIQHAQ